MDKLITLLENSYLFETIVLDGQDTNLEVATRLLEKQMKYRKSDNYWCEIKVGDTAERFKFNDEGVVEMYMTYNC